MRREPGDARAHFFAGLAHGIRAVEAMNEYRYLDALLDGRRMVALLERALALDPGLTDAYYALGVYRVRRAQVFWLRTKARESGVSLSEFARRVMADASLPATAPLKAASAVGVPSGVR